MTHKTTLACPHCDKYIWSQQKNKDYKCYHCQQTCTEPTLRKSRATFTNNRKVKREIRNAELLTREQLVQKIGGIRSLHALRDKALLSTLYLTGSRISELIGIKNKETGQYALEPLKKAQIARYSLHDESYLVINNVPILKRKPKKNGEPLVRNIPLATHQEPELVQHLINYIETLDLDDYLFKLSAQRAWQIAKKIEITPGNAIFNHYLRHLRVTHLATHYGLSALDLQQFIGWANTTQAVRYAHYNWQDLARKMTQNQPKPF